NIEQFVDVSYDDNLNEDSLLITVQVPYDPDACKDPDQDIMGIEDALIAAIEPSGLGTFDVNGISETATELFLVINKGKYPKAIKSIRKALAEIGVLKDRKSV